MMAPIGTCLAPLSSLQANSEEAEGRGTRPALGPTPVAGGQREATLERQEREHTVLLEEGRSAASYITMSGTNASHFCTGTLSCDLDCESGCCPGRSTLGTTFLSRRQRRGSPTEHI